jgi:hypothetical protein
VRYLIYSVVSDFFRSSISRSISIRRVSQSRSSITGKNGTRCDQLSLYHFIKERIDDSYHDLVDWVCARVAARKAIDFNSPNLTAVVKLVWRNWSSGFIVVSASNVTSERTTIWRTVRRSGWRTRTDSCQMLAEVVVGVESGDTSWRRHKRKWGWELIDLSQIWGESTVWLSHREGKFWIWRKEILTIVLLWGSLFDLW